MIYLITDRNILINKYNFKTMENTNTVNSVNISLSEYNVMKANFEATRDLLTKATTELNVLRNQKTDNKLIVVEKKTSDGWGGSKVTERLELDVKDPKVSEVLLDVISKVETAELSSKIEEKEAEIKRLKSQLEDNNLSFESMARNYRKNVEDKDDAYEKKLRKLKKESEEAILKLEEDKETLQKALKDLKVNKTQEQLELAREEELSQLKDQINSLNEFKDKVVEFENNPLKFRNFLKLYRAARQFRSERPWINNIWTNTVNAVERVEAFTRLLKNVGKVENKSEAKCAEKQAYYNNGYCYATTCTKSY